MMELELEKNRAIPSEQVRDVMEKMPSWVVRQGLLVILGLLLLALFFSWVIKYPEILVSEVNITTTIPSLKVVTQNSGKLHLFQIEPNMIVEKDQYLAVLDNSASVADVIRLKKELTAFKQASDKERVHDEFFKEELHVGLLQTPYREFLSTYQEIVLMKRVNKNAHHIQFLNHQVALHEEMLRGLERLKLVRQQELSVVEKRTAREQDLFLSGAVSEKEFEEARIYLLEKRNAFENFLAEVLRTKSTLTNFRNEIEQIQFAETENAERLELSLWQQYQGLYSAIADWERTYVLKAPAAGSLHFLDFWKDNQYVSISEELFEIVPVSSDLVGHADLPAYGAGKVQKGQRVKITLADFPYKEFGSVTGYVESISVLANEKETLLGKENYYRVAITLPSDLHTNFKKKLRFKQNMVGQAEIVTRDKRFIQRIFENIVYIFNQEYEASSDL